MNEKEYRSVLLIGKPKAGKSTWAKARIKKVKGKKIIYDINNEYPNDGGIFIPFDRFLDLVSSVRDHFIFIEEATIYISNKSDFKAIREIMVSRRHRNNTIFLTFHSLQQVPLNILAAVDLVVLFHTNDNYELVRKKFGNTKIFTAFNMLKRMPHPNAKLIIKLQ